MVKLRGILFMVIHPIGNPNIMGINPYEIDLMTIPNIGT